MIKVIYQQSIGGGYCNHAEFFNESDLGTNISRAIQYAATLREIGGEYIVNVKVVVDI